MLGADEQAQRIFLTSRIEHPAPAEFMDDADETMATGSIEIVSFNGDILRLAVRSSKPAWLSYIDNWDANWLATVDDSVAPIDLLFGAYKSVRVPAGESRVVFSYRPGLFP